MKYSTSLLYIFFFLFFSTACEDHRLEGMVDDRVYLLASGWQSPAMGRTEAISYPVIIYKSGLGVTEAEVALEIDETVLAEYNRTSAKKYKLLPSACYKMERTTCRIGKETPLEKVVITLDGGAIYLLQGLYTTEYVLPLRLTSLNGIAVDSIQSTVLVAPKIN